MVIANAITKGLSESFHGDQIIVERCDLFDQIAAAMREGVVLVDRGAPLIPAHRVVVRHSR